MLADDSGIEAEDLGGAPGIYSARYAGVGVGDQVNLAKLLREVDAAGGDRRAAYVCVLALIDPDGESTSSRPAARVGCCARGGAAAASATTPPSSPTTSPPATNGRCRR